MKVLIAGAWHSELHEEAVYRALIQLDHEPIRFAWHPYFKPKGVAQALRLPLLKAQNKYMLGPMVDQLNRDLLALVSSHQPDLIFVYRGTHIYPKTLVQIRRVTSKTILVGYNNDDPFSPRYPRWKWRHFLAGIPAYDVVLAYRKRNLPELTAAGARQVDLLRSWFIPEIHRPLPAARGEESKFDCDVVFIGHYESDGRLEYLEDIIRSGWQLRLFGPGYEWDDVIRKSPLLRGHAPVRLIWGHDYNRAIAGAKVALCFLSKLNRDTYTRRCFEIPATGTILLSEFSEDLADMFVPDEEAIFFSSLPEMRAKLQWLMEDSVASARIRAAGLRRVWADGHDVKSRISLMLESISKK